MKTVKARISIADYIELGGTVESLVGKSVYRTHSNQWHERVIKEANSRVIKRGIKKGKTEIKLTVHYTAIYRRESTWLKITTQMDKHYIDVDIMLAGEVIKLNEVTDKLLKVPVILGKELAGLL